ncbi:hypothetical protein QIS99_03615 [Streptomyces sp. B-S-A8]|uniref:Plasmid stabilization protein n=1 Tax=Streptomyces solicavernae TaxID=3043614 RepID=A0ABT6RLK4_9ACTN|nr:hypothetical protein [Streptomyces sp. B-S-A8]MDI3385306.1 hypothetical protein [Streptomyces sp. B-S-A8]
MAHHHKPNRAVEGEPGTGQGRGMPRRPDERQLEQRTDRERRAAGLDGPVRLSADAQYEEVHAEIDHQVGRGELRAGHMTRKARDPYPPSRYGR